MLKRLFYLAMMVVSLVVNSTFSAEATYRVGVAKVDITPDYPIRLNGYAVRKVPSEGAEQKLFGKAFAIGSAGGIGVAVGAGK